MVVVHSMGRSCPGSTRRADGYHGIHSHVTSRAAFVVSSPDPPDVQQAFAASRGWNVPMVGHQGWSTAMLPPQPEDSKGEYTSATLFPCLRLASNPAVIGRMRCTVTPPTNGSSTRTRVWALWLV